MIRHLPTILLLAALAYSCRSGSTEGTSAPEPAVGEAYPCPGEPGFPSAFQCVDLEVPLDNFTDTGETMRVSFAFRRALRASQGVFVTATGGPGSSGIASADLYLETMDPQIADNYDLVFFDQRGTGTSGGGDCPEQVLEYFRTDLRIDSEEQAEHVISATRSFVEECVARLPDSERFRYYGTRQSVRDLELFRQWFGAESLVLYGESYGTLYAQHYADAFPERVSRMILDGTIDPALRGIQFLTEQGASFSRVLNHVVEACEGDPTCREAFALPPTEFLPALFDRLEAGPIEVNYPMADGTHSPRQLELASVQFALLTALYDEEGRMLMLRDLAAASHHHFIPLLRRTYGMMGEHPVTREPLDDPTWSDAAYFTIACADSEWFQGTSEERARQYIEYARTIDDPIQQMVALADLPCAWWPSNGVDYTIDQPADVPTLVLGATLDPATPHAQGARVAGRSGSAVITMNNGPHVIFGRGLDCPDNDVMGFLATGQATTRECWGQTYNPFELLPPNHPSEYMDLVDVMVTMEVEIFLMPEYASWSGLTPLVVGCDFGGAFTVVLDHRSGVETTTLSGCALTPGVSFYGTSTYDPYTDTTRFVGSLSGYWNGNASYHRAGATWSANGVLNGVPLNVAY